MGGGYDYGMCGRYTLKGNPRKLAEFFGVDSPDLFGEPRYNVAPTQVMPIVRAVGGRRELALARWGLIPSWASDPNIGARLINARVETAAQKPAFRDAMKQRRCVVPVTGFYEWQKVGNTRQPYLIYMASGEPLGLAGLWERWRDADGRDVDTYVILTMPASAAMKSIHDRMPVILKPERYAAWLDLGREGASDLVEPWADRALAMHPVSPRVNSPRHDDASCAARIERTGLLDETWVEKGPDSR